MYLASRMACQYHASGGQFALLVPKLRIAIATAAELNLPYATAGAHEVAIPGFVRAFFAGYTTMNGGTSDWPRNGLEQLLQLDCPLRIDHPHMGNLAGQAGAKIGMLVAVLRSRSLPYAIGQRGFEPVIRIARDIRMRKLK